MFNILNHERKCKPKDTEILSYYHENGNHQENKQQQDSWSGSNGKSACQQTWVPEFNPQCHQKINRKEGREKRKQQQMPARM
jgi:hypothetical protein